MMSNNCRHFTCFDSETCRRPVKAPKARQTLRRTPLKPATVKKKANSAGLKTFYDSIISVSEPCCENCGSYSNHLIHPYYNFLFRSCIAHLLPKRNFKSIATNPLNVMILGSGISGMCTCHDIYDSSWSKASSMKIWPEVCERFKKLYPLILPEEHRFIPEILLNSLH